MSYPWKVVYQRVENQLLEGRRKRHKDKRLAKRRLRSLLPGHRPFVEYGTPDLAGAERVHLFSSEEKSVERRKGSLLTKFLRMFGSLHTPKIIDRRESAAATKKRIFKPHF